MVRGEEKIVKAMAAFRGQIGCSSFLRITTNGRMALRTLILNLDETEAWQMILTDDDSMHTMSNSAILTLTTDH